MKNKLKTYDEMFENGCLEQMWSAAKYAWVVTTKETCGSYKRNKMHKQTTWWNNKEKGTYKMKEETWKVNLSDRIDGKSLVEIWKILENKFKSFSTKYLKHTEKET